MSAILELMADKEIGLSGALRPGYESILSPSAPGQGPHSRNNAPAADLTHATELADFLTIPAHARLA
jgi:hypothetical protein